MAILLVFGFMLIAASILVGLDAALRPRVARRASLRRAASYSTITQARRVSQEPRKSLLEIVVPSLSRVALALTPKARLEEIQVRLAGAGLASRLSAQQYLALKTAIAICGAVFGLAVAGVGAAGLLLGLILIVAAIALPDFLIGRMASQRAESLSVDLPQAIDQLVVSLEAGLGLDAAISYFVSRSNSPLASELRVMLSEIRMGEARAEAMKRLVSRVPSDEVRALVQTLLQGEGMGISLSGILRSQAADTRHRRQLAAEERAHKAQVKMLIPTVIFILPVMFIITIGPALQEAKTLFGR